MHMCVWVCVRVCVHVRVSVCMCVCVCVHACAWYMYLYVYLGQTILSVLIKQHPQHYHSSRSGCNLGYSSLCVLYYYECGPQARWEHCSYGKQYNCNCQWNQPQWPPQELIFQPVKGSECFIFFGLWLKGTHTFNDDCVASLFSVICVGSLFKSWEVSTPCWKQIHSSF